MLTTIFHQHLHLRPIFLWVHLFSGLIEKLHPTNDFEVFFTSFALFFFFKANSKLDMDYKIMRMFNVYKRLIHEGVSDRMGTEICKNYQITSTHPRLWYTSNAICWKKFWIQTFVLSSFCNFDFFLLESN